jgi:hypothetical protein
LAHVHCWWEWSEPRNELGMHGAEIYNAANMLSRMYWEKVFP